MYLLKSANVSTKRGKTIQQQQQQQQMLTIELTMMGRSHGKNARKMKNQDNLSPAHTNPIVMSPNEDDQIKFQAVKKEQL